MKQCIRCYETKILTEFYEHKRMRDGHLNKCKDCCARYDKENREQINRRRNSRIRLRYATDTEYRKRRIDATLMRRGRYAPEVFNEVKRMRTEECFYCGGPGGTVDHLIPKEHGGSSELCNLVPACVSCNSSKFTKSLAEFYS